MLTFGFVFWHPFIHPDQWVHTHSPCFMSRHEGRSLKHNLWIFANCNHFWVSLYTRDKAFSIKFNSFLHKLTQLWRWSLGNMWDKTNDLQFWQNVWHPMWCRPCRAGLVLVETRTETMRHLTPHIDWLMSHGVHHASGIQSDEHRNKG